MTILSPYLRFDGNAQVAFDFYKSVLGGELSVQKVGDSPMAQMMPDKKDKIFHAQLHNGKVLLLGSDMVGEEGRIKGNSVVLTLLIVQVKKKRRITSKNFPKVAKLDTNWLKWISEQ